MSQIDRFRAALALDEDPAAAIDSIARDLASQGQGGSIGFVYVTDTFKTDLGSVTDLLRERTGIRTWIGTLGLGVIGGHQGIFDRPAIAAMIGTWPERSLKVFDQTTADMRPPFGQLDFGRTKAIVHADPRDPAIDSHLQSLANAAGAYIIGGLTASRTQCFDQVAGTIIDGGVSGVFLGPEIDVAVGVAQGCIPIGPSRTISSSHDNVITALDGDSPLKALLDDLSGIEEEDLPRLLQSLQIALPVAQSDTADYIVRNLVAIDAETGQIVIGEQIEPGRRMFFCRRDRAAATKDLTLMVQKLKARARTINGALYISCCGRGPAMFESADAEVDLVRQGLGDVPLIGFYANGEIAGQHIYGYTGVLAIF